MSITSNEAYNLAFPYAKIYTSANKKYNVNPNELAKYTVATAIKESNLNPNAKNKNSSAKGLMQIIDSTRKEIENKLGLKKVATNKIFDADYSMRLGTWYLLKQFNRYGNWFDALHAYNQGSVPGVHSQNGKDYAASVINKYEALPSNFAFNNNNNSIISTNDNDYIYNAFI